MSTHRALLVLWLLAYTVLPAGLALFALIFAFEGLGASRLRPENVLLGGTAALFLLAWPLSVLVAWWQFARGNARAAWRVSGWTALCLLVLWGLGLAAAVALGPARS